MSYDSNDSTLFLTCTFMGALESMAACGPEKKYSVSIMRGGDGRRRGRMGLGMVSFLSDLRFAALELELEDEDPSVAAELRLTWLAGLLQLLLSFGSAGLRRKDFKAVEVRFATDGAGGGGGGEGVARRAGEGTEIAAWRGGSTNGVTPPRGTVRTFFHVVSSALTVPRT